MQVVSSNQSLKWILTIKTNFYQEQQTRNEARLESLQLPQASAWLNVVPDPSLGLHLKPAEFQFTILHRLGLQLFRED